MFLDITSLEYILFYNIHVHSHNVTCTELQSIDLFSIDIDDVSSDASATLDSPPTSYLTHGVSQEPPHVFS